MLNGYYFDLKEFVNSFENELLENETPYLEYYQIIKFLQLNRVFLDRNFQRMI